MGALGFLAGVIIAGIVIFTIYHLGTPDLHTAALTAKAFANHMNETIKIWSAKP